jgi:hypothetical protein
MSEEARNVQVVATLAPGVSSGQVILTLQNVTDHPIALYKTARFPYSSRGIGWRPLTVIDTSTQTPAPIDEKHDICGKPCFEYEADRFQVYQPNESVNFTIDIRNKYQFVPGRTYTVTWDSAKLDGLHIFENLNDEAWNEANMKNFVVDASGCSTQIQI